MTTARTLQPEDQLAHYRVVGPLGSGGMGEVYLAQDQTLERNVALKVLPQELTRSEERVRRFVQEAKSASSLNHPNIITIYEIGEDEVKSATGDPAGGSVQYISMELVSGKTLGAKIHEEKTDLRTLLGYLAQAAEGIAKAHAAGIVHRDLKPGNIMVSDDGFAKVLDFGLAKLTEKRSGEASATALTEIGEQTAEGAVLGTVYYMSPEQVQGKSVDHRSDVFSFGCILYEAAARQRPFLADSNVETMHQILHDKPRPIEEVTPSVPAELRRLVRRCLNKAPDQRLQSMKDVAIELREIVDEYDALSASATSATTGSGSVAPVTPRGRRVPLVPVIAGAAVVIAAALFFGLRGREGTPPTPPNPMQTTSITTQTSRGNVTDCNLSPDGRYIAYLVSEGGQFGMYVRQVATGSDIEVLPMSDRIVESPVFSPDGDYLFYLARDPEHPLYRTLYRMASLGGSPERKAFDVDSRVSFSPDGKQFAFSRGFPQEGRTAIFTMPVGGGQEHELASIKSPEVMTSDADWSPDGKSIATVALNQSASTSRVVTFDVETGKRNDVLTRQQAFYFGVEWMSGGKDLLISGVDIGMGFTQQVFMSSYPGAQLRRITNDFNTYQVPSASSAGDLIAAVRTMSLQNLWTIGLGGNDSAVQITRATSAENSPIRVSAGRGVVYYPMVRDHSSRLFAVPPTGGDARIISTPTGHVTQAVAGGDVIVFELYNEGEQHVWRMGTDGSNPRRLSQTSGENLLAVSSDGRYASFATSDSAQGVWLAPTDHDGVARLMSHSAAGGLGLFSPRGDRILVSDLVQSGQLLRVAYNALPCEGDGETLSASPPPSAINVQWLPDGSGICFMDRTDPVRSVFSLKFGTDTPQRVTRYADQRVRGFAFSPDGRYLAVIREQDNSDNIWVSDANGANPRQLTTFAALSVFSMQWMPDSNRLALSVGNATRDVVLIRNFR